MIEVYKNLYVGSQYDYESNPREFDSWCVVHACKEPYHRRALGYTGRGAPKDSPYYFYRYDKYNHLILNIVDTDSPDFINDNMIDVAINYCVNGLKAGKKVLIHCNQGESRAPSIALLVLRKIGFYTQSFEDSVNHFISRYPFYCPKSGIFEYSKKRWDTL